MESWISLLMSLPAVACCDLDVLMVRATFLHDQALHTCTWLLSRVDTTLAMFSNNATSPCVQFTQEMLLCNACTEPAATV